MRSGIALLMIAVVVSAVLVVALRHQGRQLSTELHALQRERDVLNVEWGKLLLEEGAWSEHRRVETLAREQLDMATPDPHQVVLVDTRRKSSQ